MVWLDYSLAPRAIRLLAEHGADALRPSLINGRLVSTNSYHFLRFMVAVALRRLFFMPVTELFVRYIAPLIPRRIAGDLRKRAIIRGTFGEFSYPSGQRCAVLLHRRIILI